MLRTEIKKTFRINKRELEDLLKDLLIQYCVKHFIDLPGVFEIRAVKGSASVDPEFITITYTKTKDTKIETSKPSGKKSE